MKDKKRNFGIFLSLILILGVTNISTATIVELPLDCAGTYTTSQGWSSDFDFEVEFTDISHVYIDWEGEITAAKVVLYENPNNPFPVDIGIAAVLEEAPSWRHTVVSGGESTYPNPEPFDICSEFLYGAMPLSELFDGKGKIRISITLGSLMDGYYVEHGYAKVNNAKLVIDGNVVPEPSSIIIMVTGAIGMILRKKRNFS